MLFESDNKIEKNRFNFFGKEVSVVNYDGLNFDLFVADGVQRVIKNNESILRQLEDFVNFLNGLE